MYYKSLHTQVIFGLWKSAITLGHVINEIIPERSALQLIDERNELNRYILSKLKVRHSWPSIIGSEFGITETYAYTTLAHIPLMILVSPSSTSSSQDIQYPFQHMLLFSLHKRAIVFLRQLLDSAQLHSPDKALWTNYRTSRGHRGAQISWGYTSAPQLPWERSPCLYKPRRVT